MTKSFLIALFFLCCISDSLQSELILNVNLQSSSQTSSQVTFDLVANFVSTDGGGNLLPGHFVESIILDLLNSDAPLQASPPQDIYSRFSVINADWEAALDPSLGSILLLPLAGNPLEVLRSGQSRTLAQLVIETTGLPLGIYTVSIFDSDPTFVDAFGDFGNGPELFVADAAGVLTASPASFSVSAVPEPGSWLLSGIASLIYFARYRPARRQ